jgi:hypothetical protein
MSRNFKASSSGYIITALGVSSIFFDIDLSSWPDYCMFTSQGFISISSRILILASWIQCLFTWIHGFKDSSIGFMASTLKQYQGFFTWLHGFKASSLGFMASILKQSPFFIATSSSSMLHPYHYCHIIIITATLTSMTTFFSTFFHMMVSFT